MNEKIKKIKYLIKDIERLELDIEKIKANSKIIISQSPETLDVTNHLINKWANELIKEKESKISFYTAQLNFLIK
jgi:hypothetical protein